MALITINTIPYIIIIAAVFRIGLRLGVTNGALEDRVVRGIRMARSAYAVGSAVIHGEKVMSECCSQPSSSGVACRAGRREVCRNVVRVCRRKVNRLVAAVAIDRQRLEVVVHMAARTRN